MTEQKKIQNGTVPLEEVVKGMTNFSSNANMECLIEFLGLDYINGSLVTLGLTGHDEIYPFYVSLLIPSSLMKDYSGLSTDEKILKANSNLKVMPPGEFRAMAVREHNRLKEDIDGSHKKFAQIEHRRK